MTNAIILETGSNGLMGCFAVIRVYQDYDYVEGAECICSFPIEQEANDCVQKMEDERDASWKRKLDYIERFVDDINLPETDYHGWLEFLKSFHPFGAIYVFPKDFKKELKGYLRTHHAVQLEGYSPPIGIVDWNNLFVVEIEGCECECQKLVEQGI